MLAGIDLYMTITINQCLVLQERESDLLLYLILFSAYISREG
jgi:hypothetical protein